MKLHFGDCLEYMRREMYMRSIDMTFTSPPFKDEDVDGDYWKYYDAWMEEILHVTKKVAIIINSASRLNKIITKWPPKRTMVWGKGITCYAWRWNPIFVYQISDDYKVNKFIWSDAFGVQAVLGNWKVHKYQDPEVLYETIIKMFKGCNSVFDPFMGSGTTGVVCKKLGLDFIGCEMDSESFATAEKRINE